MADPIYNPQQPSNIPKQNDNKTTNYFNNYFIPDYTVSDNTNDAILSFFEEQTGDVTSAKLLSQAVINTAQAERVDPMVVLTQFQNLPQGDLNAILTLYLNTNRKNTSLLAIKTDVQTSPYISRTVLF